MNAFSFEELVEIKIIVKEKYRENYIIGFDTEEDQFLYFMEYFAGNSGRALTIEECIRAIMKFFHTPAGKKYIQYMPEEIRNKIILILL